ncbi:4-amino-4-deoxy-L-arabinose transferase [uncultured Gammaproteobacteria bacterium]
MSDEGGKSAKMAGTRLTVARYGVLALLALALFTPGFFTLPPFDRDEARFAQASRQMLESGDFVDIRFQDEARHKKPVGIYWLQTAAVAATGHGPNDGAIWPYRLPSLAAAVAGVLLTAWVGQILFGAEVGLMAGLMIAGCVVLGVEARLAKTDATLFALIVLAQAVLARLYLATRASASATGAGKTAAPGRLIWLFWVAQGLAILIKGPIAPLVSGATVLALAVADRDGWRLNWGWLKPLRPLAGLAVIVAIAAPWLIAITLQTKGAFFAESVGHDLLGKIASGQESKGLPPGFHLAVFWFTFAPFSFLALLAVPWVWRQRREPAVRFCLAWMIPSWLVFEAVPTKLLHYTLPLLPAVAMLAAAALIQAAEAGRRSGTKLFAGAAVSAVLGLGLLAGGLAALPWLLDQRFDGVAVAAAVVVLACLVQALRETRRLRPWPALAAALAAAAVLHVVTWADTLPSVEGLWVSRQAAAAVAAHRPCPGTVVASGGYTEPSLVFLLGTATRLGSGALAASHVRADPACALALVEAREETLFRATLADTPVTPLATFSGFNYSRGRKVALTLYAVSR